MTDKQHLEQEFVSLVDTVGKQIQVKLEVARKALEEATELADKFGIPFDAPVSELGQPYVPASFEEKFSELDRPWVEQITGVYEYDLDINGWRQSQLC
jgi:hypothetical protein